MSVSTTVLLLLSALSSAVVPGFFLLAFCHDCFPSPPTQLAVASLVSYLLKAVAVSVCAAVGVILYSDLAFPLVMKAFGAILKRSSAQKTD